MDVLREVMMLWVSHEVLIDHVVDRFTMFHAHVEALQVDVILKDRIDLLDEIRPMVVRTRSES